MATDGLHLPVSSTLPPTPTPPHSKDEEENKKIEEFFGYMRDAFDAFDSFDAPEDPSEDLMKLRRLLKLYKFDERDLQRCQNFMCGLFSRIILVSIGKLVLIMCSTHVPFLAEPHRDSFIEYIFQELSCLSGEDIALFLDFLRGLCKVISCNIPVKFVPCVRELIRNMLEKAQGLPVSSLPISTVTRECKNSFKKMNLNCRLSFIKDL